MQSTNLFVAGLAVCVGVGRGYWVRENSANPGLRSETWGTRILGGVGGFVTPTVAVRV
jgi:hypothetical protein